MGGGRGGGGQKISYVIYEKPPYRILHCNNLKNPIGHLGWKTQISGDLSLMKSRKFDQKLVPAPSFVMKKGCLPRPSVANGGYFLRFHPLTCAQLFHVVKLVTYSRFSMSKQLGGRVLAFRLGVPTRYKANKL